MQHLSMLIDAFVGDVCAGKVNETPATYRGKLNHLLVYLGDVDSLSQTDIDGFRSWMLNRKTHMKGGHEVRGPLSMFTVRTVFQTTKHFLTWGYEHKHFEKITLQQVKKPQADPKAIDGLTVEKLINYASCVGKKWEQSRNIALIYTLRDTGGRVGAVSRIDISNLDLNAGYATALDKGSQLSWLYFTPPTITAIRNWLPYRDQLKPKDFLLWTGEKRYGLSREGIYRMLNRVADEAGVVTSRHNPHSFRHAFARDAILGGADLSQVAAMLGHKSTTVTAEYYARWSRSETQRFHDAYSPGKQLPML